MTVAAQTPTISYIEDGITTAFPASFRYDAPTDVLALRRLADGSEIELAYGTDYTATPGPTNAGGTLTLTTAGPSGARLTIFRRTARVQQADYIPNGAFTAASHETALDKAMLVAQEQDAEIDRALKVPRGEGGLLLDPATMREGGVARFVGQRLVGVSLAELAVLLDPQKKAGTTLAYTETVAPRSEIDVFNPDGIGEGGYWCEFAVADAIGFVRAYAKVYAGTGTCDVQMIARGQVLWSKVGVGSTATDEVIEVALEVGDDLILIVENITGAVTGLVVKLEGEAA